MIRIPDFDRVGVELFQRFRLGRIAHPIEFLDARVECDFSGSLTSDSIFAFASGGKYFAL